MKRFMIKDIPPSNNRQLAMHWTERHRWKKRLAQAIANEAGLGPWYVSFKRKPVKAHVKIVMHRRCRVVQDEDNKFGSVKPLCDALKKTGWIVDDSHKWLRLEVEEVRDNGPRGGRTEIFLEKDTA